MRTLVMAALASLTLHTPAGACGDPTPQAFRVVSHGGRSFIVLAAVTPPKATRWTELSPYSYDRTSVAAAGENEGDRTFTLVSADGAQVVHSRTSVLVRDGWDVMRPSTTLEITAKPGAWVALAGVHTDARWRQLGQRYTSSPDARWVNSIGVKASSVSVFDIPGSKLDALSTYTADGAETFVRDGNTLVERVHGHPIGAVTVSGLDYLIVDADGIATAVMI